MKETINKEGTIVGTTLCIDNNEEEKMIALSLDRVFRKRLDKILRERLDVVGNKIYDEAAWNTALDARCVAYDTDKKRKLAEKISSENIFKDEWVYESYLFEANTIKNMICADKNIYDMIFDRYGEDFFDLPILSQMYWILWTCFEYCFDISINEQINDRWQDILVIKCHIESIKNCISYRPVVRALWNDKEGVICQLLRDVTENDVRTALAFVADMTALETNLSVASTIEAINEVERKLNNMIDGSSSWVHQISFLRMKQGIFYRKIEFKEENWKTKLREGKQNKQTKLTTEKIFSAMKDLASEEGNEPIKYTINSLADKIHGTIASIGHVTRVMKAHLGANAVGTKGKKYHVTDIIRMWNDHL